MNPSKQLEDCGQAPGLAKGGPNSGADAAPQKS
jgi:hypothetical protein